MAVNSVDQSMHKDYLMKSSRLVGALWILVSVVVFAGCGGGGGGHVTGSDQTDNGGGGDGGGGNNEAFNGVEFTEDASLDDDVTGVWIMISDLDHETQDSNGAVFSGVKRRSFALVRDGSELAIESCVPAFSVVETESTIEFEFNSANYELQKDSNTHLSGISKSAIDNSVIGQITMIKTREGPETLDDLLSFSLGTFSYDVEGAATADPMGVRCYSDKHGEETFSENNLTETLEIESFQISDGAATATMTQYVGEDYFRFEIISFPYFNVNLNDDGSIVELSIGGTNDIAITVNATDGESGDVMTGSVDLDL